MPTVYPCQCEPLYSFSSLLPSLDRCNSEVLEKQRPACNLVLYLRKATSVGACRCLFACSFSFISLERCCQAPPRRCWKSPELRIALGLAGARCSCYEVKLLHNPHRVSFLCLQALAACSQHRSYRHALALCTDYMAGCLIYSLS